MNRSSDLPPDGPSPHSGAIDAELARLRPAAPSAGLRSRVAAELAGMPSSGRADDRPVSPPRPIRWLAERLAWAGGGAVAATLLAGVAGSRAPDAVAPIALATAPPERVVATDTPTAERADPEALAEHAAPAESTVASAPVAGTAIPAAALEPVAEESLAWSDEGVRFIDGQVPARVFRHWVLERYPVSADGGNLVLPREDVFVVPVSLR